MSLYNLYLIKWKLLCKNILNICITAHCYIYFFFFFSQVFDVTLNRVHTVVSDLDIFAKVGKGVAHDEHIPFTIKGNKLIVNDEESEHDGKIRVDFIKVSLFLLD